MRSTSRWTRPCTVTTRSRSCSTDGAQGLRPGTAARATLHTPEPNGLTGPQGRPEHRRQETPSRSVRRQGIPIQGHTPLVPQPSHLGTTPLLLATLSPPRTMASPALHASSGMSQGGRGWYPPGWTPACSRPQYRVQNSHPLLWPARAGGLPTAARWQAEPAVTPLRTVGQAPGRGARLTRVNTR